MVWVMVVGWLGRVQKKSVQKEYGAEGAWCRNNMQEVYGAEGVWCRNNVQKVYMYISIYIYMSRPAVLYKLI